MTMLYVREKRKRSGLAASQKEHICSRPLLYFHLSQTPSLLLLFIIMAFNGKYELESQKNYEEFLEAIGT